MSLLIDALKQAEEARKQSAAPTAENDSPPVLSLAEEAGLTPAAGKRSDALRTDTSAPRMPSQDAARQLFEVKASQSSRVPLLLAIMGIVVFSAGAVYVWYVTQPSNLQAIRPPTHLTQPVGTVKPSTGVARLASVSESGPSNLPQAPTPEQKPQRLGKASRIPEEQEGQRINETIRSKTAARPAIGEPEQEKSAEIIKRTRSRPTVEPPTTASAFEAYQHGDIQVARARYAEALAGDPKSVDALNGLGAIALRLGQVDLAEQYFRRTLAIDPKDITALAQVTSIRSEIDPFRAESQLRTLVAEQPNSAIALFSLGGLLARQNRWPEAQQAFFQAHVLDGSNPDILYNLAVSLDHLRQKRLALRYYDEALEAATRQTASFSADAARTRILILSAPETTDTPRE